MLILGNRRFIQAPFHNEEELEAVVVSNAELIFGPSSIFLPSALITTGDGAGTVPDGYVIDFASRRWYLVEAELSRHSVWNHIAPQVTRQLIAATNPTSRQLIVNLAIERVRDDPALLERFAEVNVREIDIHRVLAEILDTDPVVAMPIDAVRGDLEQWAATLKADVKLWTVRKYVEFSNPEVVMFEVPEEYRPTLDTERAQETQNGITRYDVTVLDLIEAGLLAIGQVLRMDYTPQNGQQATFSAEVQSDGALGVLGKQFASPSYAALYCIQNAGSSRTTVNGWTSWKTEDGPILADLRERFLAMQQRTGDE